MKPRSLNPPRRAAIPKAISLALAFGFSLLGLNGKVEAQWVNVAPNLLNAFGSVHYKDGLLWASSNTDVWLSRDSGSTWSHIATLAIGPALGGDPNIVFYNNDTGLVSGQGGLYLTQDQGNSWKKILNSWVRSTCFSGTESDIITLGALGQINSTTDFGKTWNQFSLGASSFSVIGLGGGIAKAWAGSTAACYIWVTTDYGITWTKQAGGNDYDSYSFGIDSCDANRIYLTNEHDNPRNGTSHIYLSNDGGSTWDTSFAGPYPYISGAIAVTRGAIYCTTTQAGVLRSTDAGESWSLIGGPVCKIDYRSIAAINENILVVVDTDGSIWRTTNSGGNLLTTNLGLHLINAVPSSLSYGQVSCGRDSALTIVLSDTGAISEDIDQTKLVQGTNFILQNGAPFTLNPNGQRQLIVQFVPSSDSIYRDTLLISGFVSCLPRDTLRIPIVATSSTLHSQITAMGPTSFCVGDSVTLAASPVGLTYKWLKNSQTLPATGDSISVSDSGIYSLIVSNSSGCSDSTAVSVSVISAPVAGISGPPFFCTGGSTTLIASPAGFNYQWFKNGLPFPGNTTGSITVIDSAIFSVIVSNGGECSDSTSVKVTINSAPIAGISGPSSICQGSSSMLIASPAGLNYQWRKNGQQLDTLNSVVVSDSGDYSVIVSNSSGCSDSATVHVVVNALPVASIVAQDTIICAGSSTTITASGGKSYLWSDGETTSSIVVSDSGNYFVTVTDSNGCIASSNPLVVVVNATPQPSILPKMIPLICNGESDTLWTTLSGLKTEWIDSNNVVVYTGDTLISSAPGRYTLRVTDPNGCSGVSAPAQVSVQQTPPLQVAVEPIHAPAGSKVNLVLSLGTSEPPLLLDSLSFVLRFNNDLLSPDPDSLMGAGCLDSLIKVTQLHRLDKNSIAGSITFTRPVALNLDSTCPVAILIAEADLTDTLNTSVSVNSLFADAGSGMMALSVCNSPAPEFNLDPGCGDSLLLRLMSGKTLVIDRITPNPTSSFATLSFSIGVESPVSITIYDALGRVVATPVQGEMESSGQHAATFDTQGLPNGLYWCRLAGGGIAQSAKMVIAR